MRHLLVKGLTTTLTLTLLLGAPATTLAWGDVGHHLVVRLAMRRLETTAPGARALIDAALNGKPLLEATMWPDTARFQQPYLTTYNNHFVDIPFDRSDYDATNDCRFVPQKGDCVINALDRYSRVLLTPGQSARRRQDAISFILHFVGDMHQPMHATERDSDQGGNDRKICVRDGSTENCYEDAQHKKKMNLHAAWDSYIIGSFGLSENQLFDRLANRMAGMSASELEAIEQGTTVDWAEESHAVAVKNAYEIGTPGSGGFYHITTQYYSDNRENVEQQLLRGGVRLALVLKELFVDNRVHPGAVQPAPPAAPANSTTPHRNRRHRRGRHH